MSREEWLRQKRNSIVGNRYGRLVVIEYAYTIGNHTFYRCKCDCGNVVETRRDGLVNGHTSSCGCANSEWMHSGKMNRKHGLSEDRAYWVWAKIKSRCYNPNAREYPNYGGRGIKMCDEWLDPQKFIEWCYESGYDNTAPKGQCTLDRIDVDGNYEPNNCRWLNNQEQQNNRRDNRKFEHNGRVLTVAEWAREFNVSYSSMHHWLIDKKKTIEEFTTDYTPRKRR